MKNLAAVLWLFATVAYFVGLAIVVVAVLVKVLQFLF